MSFCSGLREGRSNLINGLVAAGAVVIGCSSSAFAQDVSADLGAAAPNFEMSTVDENGVDIISGSIRMEVDVVSIGNGARGLNYSIIIPSLAHAGSGGLLGSPLRNIFYYDNFSGGIGLGIEQVADCEKYFDLGGARTYFCGTVATGFTPKSLSGETLTVANDTYTFTTNSGVQYISKLGLTSRTSSTATAGIQSIVHPDGTVISIHRSLDVVSYVSNNGFQIRAQTSNNWSTTTITAFNGAVDYCAPTAPACTFTQSWPTATLEQGVVTVPSVASVQNMQGQTTKFYPRVMTGGYSGFHYDQVKPVGVPDTSRVTYEFCGPWYIPCSLTCAQTHPNPPPQCVSGQMAEWKVLKVNRDGLDWTYDYVYDIY